MFCFFHDQFIEEDKIGISINDRGFSLGDGVFDTQIAINGILEDADLHFERLLDHAVNIGIEPEKTLIELQTISTMLLARNGVSRGKWVVRTQVTRGEALRGLAPVGTSHATLVMRLSPAPPLNTLPATAIISQKTRRNEYSPLSQIKSLNYGDNLIALMEAKEANAEDAILLNTKEHVACATTSNIFIVEQGSWITPPLEDGVLSGITRMKVILEHHAKQDHISAERLKKAEEIWQTNSVIGLRQVKLQ